VQKSGTAAWVRNNEQWFFKVYLSITRKQYFIQQPKPKQMPHKAAPKPHEQSGKQKAFYTKVFKAIKFNYLKQGFKVYIKYGRRYEAH